MFNLPKPINRIGFSLVVIGFLGLIGSIWWWSISDGYRDYWSYTFDVSRSAYYGWQSMGRLSVLILAIGAVLAWAYEPTIGRWISWISIKT